VEEATAELVRELERPEAGGVDLLGVAGAEDCVSVLYPEGLGTLDPSGVLSGVVLALVENKSAGGTHWPAVLCELCCCCQLAWIMPVSLPSAEVYCVPGIHAEKSLAYRAYELNTSSGLFSTEGELVPN